MKNRRLERALYGPTIYEVTFGLLLSLALGAGLAIVFLIFKPAEVVAELPKEDEVKAGTVYYVAGTMDHLKGKQWMRKRQMLLDGTPGEVALTEDDLNLMVMNSSDAGKQAMDKAAKAEAEAAAAKAAAAAAKPAKPGKPGSKPVAAAPALAPTPDEQAPTDLITPSVLNFRIRDGVVQVGLPTTIATMGYTFPVVAQMKGTFVKQGDSFIFVPETMMIGSLPLHRFPHATEYMMQRAMTSDALAPEIMAAWKKLKNVEVDGKTIKLTI
jgi:hypothetical protein